MAVKTNLASVANGATFLFAGDLYTKIQGNLATRPGKSLVYRFEAYDRVLPLDGQVAEAVAAAEAKGHGSSVG